MVVLLAMFGASRARRFGDMAVAARFGDVLGVVKVGGLSKDGVDDAEKLGDVLVERHVGAKFGEELVGIEDGTKFGEALDGNEVGVKFGDTAATFGDVEVKVG